MSRRWFYFGCEITGLLTSICILYLSAAVPAHGTLAVGEAQPEDF